MMGGFNKSEAGIKNFKVTIVNSPKNSNAR
jgi:hypothetical protein